MKHDSRFLRWLQTLDREQFDALTDRKVWAFILLTFVAILATGSFAPWARDFFAMRFWPALFALAPVALCALVVSAKPLEKGMSQQHWGILILVTTGAFQFFMWSLVIFSNLPGATVLAALPILLCAYHGEAFRFSRAHLWWGLSFFPAWALAWLLAPQQEHAAIVGLGGLIAFGAAWTMGSHGVLRAEAARERDALKAAVDAQTLLDNVRELEQQQHLLYELRGTNHDAGNALSGLLMNLDFLSKQLQAEQLSSQDLAALRELNEDLRDSTARLRSLIEKGRETGKQADARESVNLLHITQQLVTETLQLHPSIIIKVISDDALKSAPIIRLHGGELSFYRVLQNLIKNAIEGNGQQGAEHIAISLQRDEKHLLCSVSDDGPGFSSHQLNHSSAQMTTTKANGTGLGLYTAQRILAANRGHLQRSNRDQGGAEVVIQLPLDDVASMAEP